MMCGVTQSNSGPEGKTACFHQGTVGYRGLRTLRLAKQGGRFPLL